MAHVSVPAIFHSSSVSIIRSINNLWEFLECHMPIRIGLVLFPWDWMLGGLCTLRAAQSKDLWNPSPHRLALHTCNDLEFKASSWTWPSMSTETRKNAQDQENDYGFECLVDDLPVVLTKLSLTWVSIRGSIRGQTACDLEKGLYF